jgi:hypothetical protein
MTLEFSVNHFQLFQFLIFKTQDLIVSEYKQTSFIVLPVDVCFPAHYTLHQLDNGGPPGTTIRSRLPLYLYLVAVNFAVLYSPI